MFNPPPLGYIPPICKTEIEVQFYQDLVQLDKKRLDIIERYLDALIERQKAGL
jgi:hypothetical protein